MELEEWEGEKVAWSKSEKLLKQIIHTFMWPKHTTYVYSTTHFRFLVSNSFSYSVASSVRQTRVRKKEQKYNYGNERTNEENELWKIVHSIHFSGLAEYYTQSKYKCSKCLVRSFQRLCFIYKYFIFSCFFSVFCVLFSYVHIYNSRPYICNVKCTSPYIQPSNVVTYI